ncbi:MAG TPA: hypothetical protein VIP80_12055 [Gemmatimonadales bacterium]
MSAAVIPLARRVSLVHVVAAVLLAMHAALAWSLRAPSITAGADDAVYLMLARGLRHLSYHNSWIIGAPPQAQYPPFYPGVLALAGTVFGSGLDVALGLNVLCSTAALATGFALVRRWSEPLALFGLAAAAVNPWLVLLAGLVASEPLFLFLVMQTLWWAARPAPSARTRAVAASMAIAATLTRIIGVVLVAALLVEWLLQRRLRTAAIFATVGGALIGAWFVWVLMAPRGLPGQSYIADALFPGAVAVVATPPTDSSPNTVAPDPARASPPAPPRGSPPASVHPPPASSRSLPSIIARRVWRNGQTYLSAGVFSALALPVTRTTRWDNWGWLAALAVLGILGIIELTRRLRPAILLLLCYAGLLLVWPYSLDRYLVPLIPLILILLLLGGQRLTRSWEGFGRWLIPASLTGILVASGLAANSARLTAAAACDRASPLLSPGCFGPEQRAFFAAALQAGREAPAGAVFLSPKAPTLFYLTGRRSVDVFHALRLSPDSLRAYLQASGVEYIVLSRIHLDQRWIARTLQALCAEWKLTADYREGGALLLEHVSSERGSAEQRRASCEATSRLAAGPW